MFFLFFKFLKISEIFWAMFSNVFLYLRFICGKMYTNLYSVGLKNGNKVERYLHALPSTEMEKSGSVRLTSGWSDFRL